MPYALWKTPVYGFVGDDGEYTGFDLDLAAEVVNETPLEMTNDGTVEKLCEKYAEYGLSYENWLIG